MLATKREGVKVSNLVANWWWLPVLIIAIFSYKLILRLFGVVMISEEE